MIKTYVGTTEAEAMSYSVLNLIYCMRLGEPM